MSRPLKNVFTIISCFACCLIVIISECSSVFQNESTNTQRSSQTYFPAEADTSNMAVGDNSLQINYSETQRTSFDTIGNGNNNDFTLRLNKFCRASVTLENVICSQIESASDFPEFQSYFRHIKSGTFAVIKQPGTEVFKLPDLHSVFPGLEVLHITDSNIQKSSDIIPSFLYSNETTFVWESLRVFNLSSNTLISASVPSTLAKMFPRLELLDLSNNSLASFIPPKIDRSLKIDLSGNPLDCTMDFDWIESSKWELVKINITFCERPPHQNKPKPFLKVYPLVKKVRNECRNNCTCYVDYIWEQEKTIHSKTTVNCSFLNYVDFPDPDKLPRPTDTLYLSNNMIRSVTKFVEDSRYTKLRIMNLYLNNNKISSIVPLEGSDWFYNFQILSLRNNEISEVPVYALGNVIRQNKKLYFIDLSNNRWNCDCHYVTGFKMWLLRNTPYIKNIEEVRCLQTNEQVRQMRPEDWCKNDGAPLIEILDLVSITLALLIVLIICKVYYDYWNYKHNGILPWLVSKM